MMIARIVASNVSSDGRIESINLSRKRPMIARKPADDCKRLHLPATKNQTRRHPTEKTKDGRQSVGKPRASTKNPLRRHSQPKGRAVGKGMRSSSEAIGQEPKPPTPDRPRDRKAWQGNG